MPRRLRADAVRRRHRQPRRQGRRPPDVRAARARRAGRPSAFVGRICRELVADADAAAARHRHRQPRHRRADGVIAITAHLGWTDLPLAAELSASSACRCASSTTPTPPRSPSSPSASAARRNLICVRVDEGVGAGLVLDGRLFTGSSHAAGEIGHVVVDADGALCACGKRGCLETEVSEPLLNRRLEAAGRRCHGHPAHAPASTSAPRLATVRQRPRRHRGRAVRLRPRSSTETFRAAAVDAIAARDDARASATASSCRPSTLGFDDVHRRRRRHGPRPGARASDEPSPPPSTHGGEQREHNPTRAVAGGAGHRRPARRRVRRRRRRHRASDAPRHPPGTDAPAAREAPDGERGAPRPRAASRDRRAGGDRGPAGDDRRAAPARAAPSASG